MEIIQLSPEQKRLWGERMKPLNEKWVAEMESKGRPGKAGSGGDAPAAGEVFEIKDVRQDALRRREDVFRIGT